jgi:hypothetical protein
MQKTTTTWLREEIGEITLPRGYGAALTQGTRYYCSLVIGWIQVVHTWKNNSGGQAVRACTALT